MPDDRQNVVPFQQDAGFFARRALKKQKDGLFQQAVVLLRRAMEAAPEHHEYLLDMAEIYSEMGCPIESNRCLARLMRRPDAPEVCWFGMACNLFAMGNVQGAQAAALNYLERAPEGDYSAQAADMITAIHQAQSLHRPEKRGELRLYRRDERAASLLNRDRASAALRLFQGRFAPDTPNQRALYAFALGEAGRKADAAREARLALSRGRLSDEARVNALQALILAGENQRALALADAMNEKELEPYEQRRVLDALFALRPTAALQPRLSQALRLSPFDRALLHAQAALYYNEGDAEGALVWWRHMLEINPQDPVAALCVQAVTGDAPPARPIPLRLALPEELEAAQRRAIDSAEGDALLAACRWALLGGLSPADGAVYRAVDRLAGLDDEQSETLLREALLEPMLTPPVKLAARDALIRRGAKEPFLVIGRDALEPASSERAGAAVSRALKACVAALSAVDGALLPAFLEKWSAALPRLEGRGYACVLGCGLALLNRLAVENDMPPEEAIRRLGLSRRYLTHYERKLNRLTGGQAHEMHRL